MGGAIVLGIFLEGPECNAQNLLTNKRRIKHLNKQEIVKQIDAEITKLRQVRTILVGEEQPANVVSITQPTRRFMSDEARKRISQAQKKRWAKAKKAA